MGVAPRYQMTAGLDFGKSPSTVSVPQVPVPMSWREMLRDDPELWIPVVGGGITAVGVVAIVVSIVWMVLS